MQVPDTIERSEMRDASGQNPQGSSRPTPVERVLMALCDASGAFKPGLVALCAEPGMGRHGVLTAVLRHATELGTRVARRDFSEASPPAVSRSLVRLARQLADCPDVTVVGLYEIPSSDESCVARQARALRRMYEEGASVLLVLGPEARQLLESLPECLVIPSGSLLRPLSPTAPADGPRNALALSRGIPSLVDSLQAVPEDAVGREPSSEYFDALGVLTGRALRPSLSDEERRLRLSMILLGTGSAHELSEVLGAVHSDLLAGVRETAPLFGVTRDCSAFGCLSAVDPHALTACLRSVAPTSALFPEVAPACLRLLVERGSIGRAATLALLPECAAALDAVLDHSGEFIDIGECRLVLHALDLVEQTGDVAVSTTRAVVLGLDSRGVCTLPTAGAARSGATDELGLLVETRRLLWGEAPESRGDPVSSSELARRLATHVGACSLMLRGAFTAALGLLLGASGETGGDCASALLLEVDRDLATTLAGGRQLAGDARAGDAEEFIRRHPLRGLIGYLGIRDMLRALLGAGDEGAELDAAVASSERSGDPLVQVVALIVGACADLRGGAAARAQVRASRAEIVSRPFDADYLNRIARLIVDVARFQMGDELPPRYLEEPRDDLDEVRLLVWEVTVAEGEPRLSRPPRDEVPWDGLWLLRVLCTGVHGLSDALLERMPTRWRRALTSTGFTPSAPSPDASRHPGEEPAATPAKPVRLSLLGGFSLSIWGRDVPEERLNRRNVKSMLEYLVLRGGSAKRFQVVEQVWPDSDYVRGFGRVYQAASALRSIVSGVDPDMSLLVANRSSGEIAVDMGLIGCDVPEFRAAAREAVDSPDVRRSLECALEAERLYRGDLYLPPADASGFVARLRSELRALYADAMVEGSEAALSLGRDRTAVRLAEGAVTADGLREDAVNALTRALTACGRDGEAARQRRAFEGRVARAPSGARRARGARA